MLLLVRILFGLAVTTFYGYGSFRLARDGILRRRLPRGAPRPHGQSYGPILSVTYSVFVLIVITVVLILLWDAVLNGVWTW